MIIGTAVAEAELKHQSGHMFYQLSRTIEASVRGDNYDDRMTTTMMAGVMVR